MRVLLDENLPHRLRFAINGHQVETASYNGWNGLKNGDLLRVAEASGVEVLVTADQNLTYSTIDDGKTDCDCGSFGTGLRDARRFSE